MLSNIFKQFIAETPVTVMARGLMERIFAPKRLDDLFENYAQEQYQQDLLFSSQVDLMSLVVCGIQPSVHAAYRAKATELSVSTTALYNKLQGIEPRVSQALLRETMLDLKDLIKLMGGEQPNKLPGYQIKILDGTCLAPTERRLDAIRSYAAQPLPGKALVVLDPIKQLVIDVFPCEDAYTQERALLEQVIARVEERDVWMGDRNFCTAEFLTSIAEREAYFIIRQHGSLGWKPRNEPKYIGKTKTGKLFEQQVQIQYGDTVLSCRRVIVKLFNPTRDGDSEIAILTNLSPMDASAATVAELYQKRWRIETLFQTVTENFNGEINSLAYPKAALFSYCMALIAYNILATLRAALGSVHGVGKIAAGLSDFYIVDEIQGTYRGMMIAIPPPEWKPFEEKSNAQMARWLQECASRVHLKRFLKTPRSPKKKRKPLIIDRKHRHLSTARRLKDHAASS